MLVAVEVEKLPTTESGLHKPASLHSGPCRQMRRQPVCRPYPYHYEINFKFTTLSKGLLKKGGRGNSLKALKKKLIRAGIIRRMKTGAEGGIVEEGDC